MHRKQCLCGSQDVINFLYAEKEKKQVLKCKKCGLGWTDPPPVLNYDEYDFRDYLKYEKVHQARPKRIFKLLQKYKKSETLLELGCGIGFLLKIAKDNNFQVKGIEASGPATQQARKLLGKDIIEKCDATKFAFSSKSYDCIVMDNYLEHIADPLEHLKKLRNTLKDDGIIVVCSPDIDGAYVKLMKAKSYILRLNEHLWQFTLSSMKALLKEAGYAPVEIKRLGFIDNALLSHTLRLFRFSRTGIKDLIFNSLNYILGKLGVGDMFILIAKKA